MHSTSLRLCLYIDLFAFSLDEAWAECRGYVGRTSQGQPVSCTLGTVGWVYCTGDCWLGVLYWRLLVGCTVRTGDCYCTGDCWLGVLYWGLLVGCTVLGTVGCVYCTGDCRLGVLYVLGTVGWVYCTGDCLLGVLYWGL